MTRHTLETLTFDNSYARLPEVFYAKVNPTPFGAAPFLISANDAAMELLDLDPQPRRSRRCGLGAPHPSTSRARGS